MSILGTVEGGTSLSKYRIIDRIGFGQFGQVFCGIHRQTGQMVALKQLDPSRLTTSLLLRELNLLASLQHPNIVAFQTLEYSGTDRYLVMDYCEGGTLRPLMEQPGQVNLGQCLSLIQDVLHGLSHAHQQGVVHCDLKPENILLSLTETGWMAHLSDFGVARLLSTPDHNSRRGDTGSPAYMAPERFYSDFCPASDLYAVGVLLYELVVGERPFVGNPGDLMTAHLNQPIQIPDSVPLLVSCVIRQAMQKLPQKRFDSASDMLQAVRLAKDVVEADTISFPHVLLTGDSPSDVYPVTAPVYSLVAGNNRIYLGMDSQVCARSVDEQGRLGGVIHQYHVSNAGRVVQFYLSARGLYWRCTSGSAQTLAWAPDSENEIAKRPSGRILASWTLEHLGLALDPQGTWMAISAPEQSQAQIVRLPTLDVLNSVGELGTATHLVVLNRRHGLAVIPGENGQTLFRLFNRRGQVLDYYQVPIQIEQIVQGLDSPYCFFALATSKTALGLLIRLNPLQVKRIPLPLVPVFCVATCWGYLLADQAGHMVCIDSSGELQEQRRLPLAEGEVVTAIASFSQSKLIAATWSGQKGALYTFKLES